MPVHQTDNLAAAQPRFGLGLGELSIIVLAGIKKRTFC
jgi:hypothetical protein